MWYFIRHTKFRCICGEIYTVLENFEDGGSDGDSLDFRCSKDECGQYYKKVCRIKAEQIIEVYEESIS